MSNLKELEKKYEELGKEIERLKKNQSIENDPIFLLSTEEYEKYRYGMPQINCWWWLRPSCCDSFLTPFVFCRNFVCEDGCNVNDDSGAVRPALRISNFKSEVKLGIRFYENRIVFNGITWIKIDRDLYISEVPIAFRRFDEKSNDYENSEVRKFLLDWFEERQVLNR